MTCIPRVTLLLALAAGLPSWADTDQVPGAVSAEAPIRSATVARVPAARAVHSNLEDRVQTLTKALNLDAAQQSELKKVLAMQREQVAKVWSDPTVPSAYRISATRAISNQTSERIRSLLTEEQRKQFSQASQRPNELAPGALSTEDWMNAARKGHP